MLGRLLAIASATVLLAAPPAAANHVAGAAPITGTGTVSPGLSPIPSSQHWSMSGRVTGGVVLHDRPYALDMSCFLGGSGYETELEGTGDLTGNCLGNAVTTPGIGTVDASCSARYARTGTAILWRGLCTFTAKTFEVLGVRTTTAVGCVRGQITFTWTTPPMRTSYMFVGGLEFHTPTQLSCFTAP